MFCTSVLYTQDIRDRGIVDSTWPQAMVYNPKAYYEWIDSQCFDKIAIRETSTGKEGFFVELFSAILPREWNPYIDKIVTWRLDLIDALSIGAQDLNPTIVQKALAKIPYSKIALSSGRTTDFMVQEQVVPGKVFKLDQAIGQACDMLTIRVNKCRTTKVIAVLTAVSCALLGNRRIRETVFAYPAALAKIMLEKGSPDLLSRVPVTNTDELIRATTIGQQKTKTPAGDEQTIRVGVWLSRSAAAAATIDCALVQYSQNCYVTDGITVLELLVNANPQFTTFDRQLAYSRIAKLKRKISWFGITTKNLKRLQAVLDESSRPASSSMPSLPLRSYPFFPS